MGQEEHIKKIAESVSKNSYDWVLVLGAGISYDGMKAADKELEHQIQQYDNKENMCQAVQKRSPAAVNELLFGNIWSDASFPDAEGMKQKARRKKYAKKFAVREKINLECYETLDLRSLLRQFPGMILTTCQDETVEAFMEDEACMVIDNQICTPDSLTTSDYWKYNMGQSRILLKLYGTCQKPYSLLLSEDDINLYYPVKVQQDDEERKPPTITALERLFRDKNLLFIGMGLPDEEFARKPFLADGIMKLLEKKEAARLRYVIMNDTKYAGEWRKYHTEPIICSDISELICQLSTRIDGIKGSSGTAVEDAEDAGVLSRKEAEEVFWKIYTRRPKHHLSDREKHILERHIWEVQEGTDNTKYTKREMEKLAMTANTFADFNDLWDAVKLVTGEKENKNRLCNEKTITHILDSRISRRSREMLQILYFYGEGFPTGFLGLIAENKKDLDDWKRAGIGLINSGIYMQSFNRKKIYEQIKYADCLMQTAGSDAGKRRPAPGLQENDHCVKDSYFYPVKTETAANDVRRKTRETYQKMFNRLIRILADKSEEYSHMCSLLETELPTLLGIMEDKMENYENKPELLYYLFLECQIQPGNAQTLLENIRKLQRQLDSRKNGRYTLCRKLMLCQAEIIIISRQGKLGKQKRALRLCDEADQMIRRYNQSRHGGKNAPVYERIFTQQIQLCLLKSSINGRIASIMEVRRCHCEDAGRYPGFCRRQDWYLNQMEENLAEAARVRKMQSKATGNSYGFLRAEINCQRGQYYFKRSQYWHENFTDHGAGKDQEKEMEYYAKSETFYKRALDFYQNNPGQYLLQKAGVLRSMADLYCRMEKSGIYSADAYRDKFYKYLEDAYLCYRSCNNLHGIADVLQSMGEMEDFKKAPDKERRSGICFFHAADKIYDQLGDEWSRYVLSAFLKDAQECQKKFSRTT